VQWILLSKACLKTGDILIEFEDKKIDNLYDFTYALRVHNPATRYRLTVLRGTEKMTPEVTPEIRK